jgi:putative N-acetylmannosamine-6-phosphate epimerase
MRIVESTLSPPRDGRQKITGQKVKKIAKIIAPPLFGLIKRDFDLQSVIAKFRVSRSS